MNVQYLVLTINNFLTRLNYKLIFQLLSFFLNKKFDSSGIFFCGWVVGGGSRGGSQSKKSHTIFVSQFFVVKVVLIQLSFCLFTISCLFTNSQLFVVFNVICLFVRRWFQRKSESRMSFFRRYNFCFLFLNKFKNKKKLRPFTQFFFPVEQLSVTEYVKKNLFVSQS